MKYSAASPRRPSAIIRSYCSTWSAGGRAFSSRMNGGSQSASLLTGAPLAVAISASAAPDDEPQSWADPPAASITASMSSTSRSIAYGSVSPLSPRPRRS